MIMIITKFRHVKTDGQNVMEEINTVMNALFHHPYPWHAIISKELEFGQKLSTDLL